MKAQELARIRRNALTIRNHVNAGYCIGQISEILGEDIQTIWQWFDNYAEPADSHKIIHSSETFKSIIPIYLMHPDDSAGVCSAVEVIGTGVVVRVNSALYLLTAYHAMRVESGYSLGMRMDDGGIYSFNGLGFGVEKRHHRESGRDTVDIGMFNISEMHPLPSYLKPFEPKEVDLTEADQPGRVITITGFPIEAVVEGEHPQSLAITGYEDNIIPVAKYGYNEDINICMRFSRRSAVFRGSSRTNMPHPVGMSGGAILSWPATYEERAAGDGIKLQGIFHTRESQIHTYCGTRIHFFLRMLAEQHPDVFEEQ